MNDQSPMITCALVLRAAVGFIPVLVLLLGPAALPSSTLAAGPSVAPVDVSYVGLKDPTLLSPYCALTGISATPLVPSRVGCAAQCAALGVAGADSAPGACFGFNYLTPPAANLTPTGEPRTCQLFQYAPNAFGIQPGCAYYWLRSAAVCNSTQTKGNNISTVPAQNCSFPFTYNGQLYYSCVHNVTGVTANADQSACLMPNRTWALCYAPGIGCFPYTPYIAQNLTATIKIPNTNSTIQVMTVGGWIIYQQRLDPILNFSRSWIEYRDGFGTLGGNYWLGNENVHNLVSSGAPYKIRFEVLSTLGVWQSAEYYYFVLNSESQFYKLHVGGYSGDIPDGMDYTANQNWQHNGMMFTTFDSDHDLWAGNCAQGHGGGWWYSSCFMASLNGYYYSTGGEFSFWSFDCPGSQCYMQNASRMMIKPI